MVEVLPAPFGPRKPKVSPCSTRTSIPSTAANCPNRLTRPMASTIGASGARVPRVGIRRGCRRNMGDQHSHTDVSACPSGAPSERCCHQADGTRW